MSLKTIIEKEFQDVRRSRMLWGLLGFGVGAMLFMMSILEIASSESPSGSEFLGFFSSFGGQLLFPILALMIGYMAIVGERQSGSLRILHGLPHSRGDILFGKFIGRSTVIAATVGVSFVAVTVLGVLLLESLSFVEVIFVTGATTLLTVTFVGIAVSISAVSASRGRAMASATGVYIIFAVIWEPLVAGIHYMIEGSLVGLEAPAWYFLLRRMSPIHAYTDLMSAILSTRVQTMFAWPVERIPVESAGEDGALLLSNRVAGDLPFYLEGWFSIVVFSFWTVLMLGIGYRSFQRTDIA